MLAAQSRCDEIQVADLATRSANHEFSGLHQAATFQQIIRQDVFTDGGVAVECLQSNQPAPATANAAVNRLSLLLSQDSCSVGSSAEQLANLAILEGDDGPRSVDLYRGSIVRQGIVDLADEFDPVICAIVLVCHVFHCFLSRHEFHFPFRWSIRVSSILRDAPHLVAVT